jgi:hypothetical protein
MGRKYQNIRGWARNHGQEQSIHVQSGRVEVSERDRYVEARDHDGCAGADVFAEQPTAIVVF